MTDRDNEGLSVRFRDFWRMYEYERKQSPNSDAVAEEFVKQFDKLWERKKVALEWDIETALRDEIPKLVPKEPSSYANVTRDNFVNAVQSMAPKLARAVSGLMGRSS